VTFALFRPWLVMGALLATGACTPGSESQPGADAEALRTLEARIAELERRKSRVEDVSAIKRLQHAYGYYVDKGLWDEVVDLFADDATVEYGLDGVYVGKERIREYLYALGGGKQGLAEGELNEHYQVMPVVTVAPDGMSAKARWRAIIMTGRLGESAFWGEGPYENEYVKEDGVWKIKTLHWYSSLRVPYEGGWQTNPDPTGGRFVTALTPDRPPSVEYGTWPDVYVPPFHFQNPVRKYDPAEAVQ
jgi:hypothetical protein